MKKIKFRKNWFSRQKNHFFASGCFCAAALALLLATTGCESSSSHLADGHDFGSNNPILYVAFGDSITYGTGVAAKDNYPTKLAGMMMRSVINEGYEGVEASEAADMVLDILNDYKPGFLLILFGVNDLIMGRDEDGIIDNLQYICQAAVNNKTIPVIATLTPACGPYRGLASGIERVNANIRLMAAAINVTVVDLEAAFNWNPVYLQDDGLHPTAQGYELMARTFYDVVN